MFQNNFFEKEFSNAIFLVAAIAQKAKKSASACSFKREEPHIEWQFNGYRIHWRNNPIFNLNKRLQIKQILSKYLFKFQLNYNNYSTSMSTLLKFNVKRNIGYVLTPLCYIVIHRTMSFQINFAKLLTFQI